MMMDCAEKRKRSDDDNDDEDDTEDEENTSTTQFVHELTFNHAMIERKIECQKFGFATTNKPHPQTPLAPPSGGNVVHRFGQRVQMDPLKLCNPKKKRKSKKKNADVEKIVTFKPLVGGTGPADRQSTTTKPVKIEEYQAKMRPLPDEQAYLADIPLKFFDHQIDAVRWMYWIEAAKRESDKHVGGILGDVMGLGKTIDCLGLIYYDFFTAKKRGLTKPEKPTLIVAPLTLLHHWKSEAINRLKLTEEDVLVYHTTKRFKLFQDAVDKGKKPTIVIATYETVQNDYARFLKGNGSLLYTTQWSRILLDEAHIARNPKTNTFKALKNFKTRAVFCVTGTPIVNYPDDVRMLSLLCTPSNPLTYGSSMQETIWKKHNLLRRTKDMLQIPPITQHDVWIDFSPRERAAYQQLESWAQTTYDQLVETQMLTKKFQKILLVLIRLRQACDHLCLQKGHDVTSALLLQTKKELGIPLEPFNKRKREESSAAPQDSVHGADCLFQDPLVFTEDTCFIETEEESKRRKRRKKSAKPAPVSIDEEITENKRPRSPEPEQPQQQEEDEENREHKKQKIDATETEQPQEEVSISIDQVPDDVTTEEPNTAFLVPPPPVDMSEAEYSSKMLKLIEILESIKEKDPGGKTVVFSQFTTMLDVVEMMLLKLGYKVGRFDGRQQKSEARTQIIHSFVHDPEYTVLLVSLKAGGVGLNLIPARYEIMMDPWWNTSVEYQAFDRVHRIGQTHPVTIYRLLVKKSIEEEVLAIQRKKENQESHFYDSEGQRSLSVKDIHTVFTTMKYRQSKMRLMV